MVCSQKEPNTIFWPNGSLKGGALSVSIDLKDDELFITLKVKGE